MPDYCRPVAGVSLLARGHSRPIHTREKNEVSIPQPSNEQAKTNTRQPSFFACRTPASMHEPAQWGKQTTWGQELVQFSSLLAPNKSLKHDKSWSKPGSAPSAVYQCGVPYIRQLARWQNASQWHVAFKGYHRYCLKGSLIPHNSYTFSAHSSDIQKGATRPSMRSWTHCAHQMQHTCHSFCTFRSFLDCSSSISFYLFSSKQPEIVDVISRLSSRGKDQIHIWVALYFSIYDCQVFPLPTSYSTRYHPSGGQQYGKIIGVISLSHQCLTELLPELSQNHTSQNILSVPAPPEEASTPLHQEVANEAVNTRSVPSTSKNSYHHNSQLPGQ